VSPIERAAAVSDEVGRLVDHAIRQRIFLAQN
jgi:hypothetical protein